MKALLPFLLLSFASSALVLAVADESSHTYRVGEPVVLWASRIGPYHNPSEAYPYFSVPGICPPLPHTTVAGASDSLGVLLEGDNLEDTGIRFPFRTDVASARICDLDLSSEVMPSLSYVVENHYWFQLMIDDLPAFGMLGEWISAEEMAAELAAVATPNGAPAAAAGAKPATALGFIYTHRDFSLSYNGDRVIEVNLTSENPRPLVLGEVYPMTYSVKWTPSSLSFDQRFDRYLDPAFFEHQIHWFSLLNSFMMVVFLCALVLLILSRTIKTALAPNASGAGSALLEKCVDPETGATSFRPNSSSSPGPAEVFGQEDAGWKLLVGDVFRAPRYLLLYSVLLGTGVQLFLLVLALLLLALISTVYDESRGLLTALFLITYSLTSGASGYVAGSYYKLHGGLHYKRALVAVMILYPSLVLGVVLFLSILSLIQGSNTGLSLGALAMVVLVWVCVSVPLSIAGTLFARQRTQTGVFPCRVNAIRRLIPSETQSLQQSGSTVLPLSNVSVSWYSNYWVLVLMAGILPFGSIFIELTMVLTSFWSYKFYYVRSNKRGSDDAQRMMRCK